MMHGHNYLPDPAPGWPDDPLVREQAATIAALETTVQGQWVALETFQQWCAEAGVIFDIASPTPTCRNERAEQLQTRVAELEQREAERQSAHVALILIMSRHQWHVQCLMQDVIRLDAMHERARLWGRTWKASAKRTRKARTTWKAMAIQRLPIADAARRYIATLSSEDLAALQGAVDQ